MGPTEVKSNNAYFNGGNKANVAAKSSDYSLRFLYTNPPKKQDGKCVQVLANILIFLTVVDTCASPFQFSASQVLLFCPGNPQLLHFPPASFHRISAWKPRIGTDLDPFVLQTTGSRITLGWSPRIGSKSLSACAPAFFGTIWIDSMPKWSYRKNRHWKKHCGIF